MVPALIVICNNEVEYFESFQNVETGWEDAQEAFQKQVKESYKKISSFELDNATKDNFFKVPGKPRAITLQFG